MAQVADAARSFCFLLPMPVFVASALVASPPGSSGPGADFYRPDPGAVSRRKEFSEKAGIPVARIHELFNEANRIYEAGQANLQMEPFVARLTLGERALLLTEIDVRQTDRGPLRNPVQMAALRESVLVHIQLADARATGVDLERIRRAVDRSLFPADFSPAERKILRLEEIIRGARRQHKTLREKVHALMDAQARANLKAFNALVVAGRYAEAEKFGRQNIPWGALRYDIAGRPIPLELPPGKLFPSDYKLRRDLLPPLPKQKQSAPHAATEAVGQGAAKIGRPGEDPLHADFPGLAGELGPIRPTLEYAAAEDKAIKARVEEYNRLIIKKQWDRALRYGRAKLPLRLVNLDEKGQPLFIADFEMVRDHRHVGFKAQVVKSNDMMSWHRVTAVHEREASEFFEVTVEGMPKPIQGTPEHPVFIVGRGWVEIKDINVGEKGVDRNGRHVKILGKKYVKLDKPVKVYNLTVEGAHTFFVGEGGGLLVHNAENYGPPDAKKGLHSLLVPNPGKPGPHPYLLLKNGQVLDVSHVTDTQRETEKVIDQMDACMKQAGDTCRIKVVADMPARMTVSTTEVEINKKELGLEKGESVDSADFRNAVRGVMLTHNYLNEHRESAARVIGKAGTVFREEDLPSASVGIEIEIERRKNSLSLEKAEEKILKSMGGAALKVESREHEPNKRSYVYHPVGVKPPDGFNPDPKTLYQKALNHESGIKGIKVTESSTQIGPIKLYPLVQHAMEGGDVGADGAQRKYEYDETKKKLIEKKDQ